MFVIDPTNFLADTQAKPFVRDFRSDLLAPDIKTQSVGRYFIAEHRVPRGTVLVVKGLVPYACERTDVGTVNEAFDFIDPEVGNGNFSFEPQINGNAPFISSIDYNAPRTASGTKLNADRVRQNGYSQISKRPLDDAKNEWFNPMYSFVVPADATLAVIFTILRVGTTSPIPNPFSIGVATEKRVDFAGVVLVGLEMPEQAYNQALSSAQKKV